MINVEYTPGIPNVSDGITIGLTVAEVKRIRAALSELDDDDLGNFGGILEDLRRSIPQQFGR